MGRRTPTPCMLRDLSRRWHNPGGEGEWKREAGSGARLPGAGETLQRRPRGRCWHRPHRQTGFIVRIAGWRGAEAVWGARIRGMRGPATLFPRSFSGVGAIKKPIVNKTNKPVTITAAVVLCNQLVAREPANAACLTTTRVTQTNESEARYQGKEIGYVGTPCHTPGEVTFHHRSILITDKDPSSPRLASPRFHYTSAAIPRCRFISFPDTIPKDPHLRTLSAVDRSRPLGLGRRPSTASRGELRVKRRASNRTG
jgi:hypothetical protein